MGAGWVRELLKSVNGKLESGECWPLSRVYHCNRQQNDKEPLWL